jgi:glutamine synthetase
LGDHLTAERPALSVRFGARVFNRGVMKRMLPAEVYKDVISAIDRRDPIHPKYADAIAIAMKEWASSHGATHFCHWFQPLTGLTAEKHDSFLQWEGPDEVIEKFDGKQLIQGEPDASSFPSGGLRSTYEARGYTGWDPTTPPFIWRAGDGITLMIPSVFFSWTGDVLDHKIPLLRADERLNGVVLRLLEQTGTKAERVTSTMGWEQEYFVVDRELRNLRPDLVIAGRTLFGAPPAKGQELEDHYFGAINDRLLAYMQDVEDHALELGIPLKTRHNEVAPSQHEFAAVYEKSSVSVDHNILMMELMRQVAAKHGLACLLHEKPFEGINGSGKHNNWSLATDTGINLLDPTDEPENHLRFLFILTAILSAVHRHADLLRASIGSAGNDHRLGANEAPPAIISVYLGEQLEEVLDSVEKRRKMKQSDAKRGYDLGIPVIPHLPRDLTDRNRTSPLAFTGDKFEFRAVGSAASCALPITILNVIVAEALEEMLDEVGERPFGEGALDVLRRRLFKSRAIRFSGDNYSAAWHREAEKRKLPNVPKSLHAMRAFRKPKAAKAFKGILSKEELFSRVEIFTEQYAKTVRIEARLMIELFNTQVLPATLKTLALFSTERTSKALDAFANRIQASLDKAIDRAARLERLLLQADKLSNDAAADHFCDKVMPACDELRTFVDELEGIVDDAEWPLTKYSELLWQR